MTDFSDLNDLEADLRQAGVIAGVKALKVVEDSCQRIEEAARPWVPRKRLPHLANTLNHDVTVEGGAIVGEVGFDRTVNKQANLAHLFEYGTSKLAPRASIGPAFDIEQPTFAKNIEEIGGEVL